MGKGKKTRGTLTALILAAAGFYIWQTGVTVQRVQDFTYTVTDIQLDTKHITLFTIPFIVKLQVFNPATVSITMPACNFIGAMYYSGNKIADIYFPFQASLAANGIANFAVPINISTITLGQDLLNIVQNGIDFKKYITITGNVWVGNLKFPVTNKIGV